MVEEELIKENGAESVEVKLTPDNGISSKRIYSNYVQVANSPYDVTLRFCDAGPIVNTKEIIDNGGIFNIPVVAEIVIPSGMMPNLIKALQSQLDKSQGNK